MTRKDGLTHYKNLDLQHTDNDKALQTVYEKWADSYDSDNDEALGTVSQPNCVRLLSQHLPDKQAYVLDVGCGTGIVGTYLKSVGYHHFDGVDLSPHMLLHAKNKGYQKLIEASLNDKLPIADNTYDGVLCVGVFTHGHVTSNGLSELVRITKPSGLICFTINEGVYDDYGFELAIKALTDQNRWHILHFAKDDYMTKKDVKAYYIVAQVTSEGKKRP
ncbi:MAG: class I SAM-dependent DNA methyltransferase [Candidatus Puniceispirillaceae bacterium]